MEFILYKNEYSCGEDNVIEWDNNAPLPAYFGPYITHLKYIETLEEFMGFYKKHGYELVEYDDTYPFNDSPVLVTY